jgi:hypothetical protein
MSNASDVPIGDPRPAGEEGPAGDLRAAGEAGPAGDPRGAGRRTFTDKDEAEARDGDGDPAPARKQESRGQEVSRQEVARRTDATAGGIGKRWQARGAPLSSGRVRVAALEPR